MNTCTWQSDTDTDTDNWLAMTFSSSYTSYIIHYIVSKLNSIAFLIIGSKPTAWYIHLRVQPLCSILVLADWWASDLLPSRGDDLWKWPECFPSGVCPSMECSGCACANPLDSSAMIVLRSLISINQWIRLSQKVWVIKDRSKSFN